MAEQHGADAAQSFLACDQQSQWQTGTADSSIKVGWGGQVADQIASMNGVQNVATAIAVNGRSSFQQGATVTPFQVSSSGSLASDACRPGPPTRWRLVSVR